MAASLPGQVPKGKENWVDPLIYPRNDLSRSQRRRASSALPHATSNANNIPVDSSSDHIQGGEDLNENVSYSSGRFRAWWKFIVLIGFLLLGYTVRDVYVQRTDDCNLSVDVIKSRWKQLQNEASTEIFGQHLAVEGTLHSLFAHLIDPNPAKALVLAFHGQVGSGKTFFSHMIARNLFECGISSRHVRSFLGTRHFLLDPIMIRQNQKKLSLLVENTVRECGRSLFIFDEVDKMPVEILDSLIPFTGHNGVFDGVDYRKGIFIFLSNTGMGEINNITLKALMSGRTREELKMEEFDSVFAEQVQESNDLAIEDKSNEPVSFWGRKFGVGLISSILSGFKKYFTTCNCSIADPHFASSSQPASTGILESDLSRRALVDRYLPFLPLERSHIVGCIEKEILRRKLTSVDPIKVADRLHYFPVDEEIFSKDGCKNVPSHLTRYVTDAQGIFKDEF